jgi:hypothetical protein
MVRPARAGNKDKRGRAYVVFVQTLLRRQTGEAEGVWRILVDGIGDALSQGAHLDVPTLGGQYTHRC